MLHLSAAMHFLPLYSFILMLMPLFNPVDLRIQAASVSPLYAHIYKLATPNPPKYEMTPPISTVSSDTVSRLTAISQSSSSGNKYRFSSSKKGTAAGSSNTKPGSSAIKRPSSVTSSTDNMPARASSIIQVPFSVIQFLGSPLVHVYRLFKPEVPATARYSQEASTPKQHPIVTEICQVLASSRVYYPGCVPVSADRDEMFREMTWTWTWSAEDENGVKWKRVTEGI